MKLTSLEKDGENNGVSLKRGSAWTERQRNFALSFQSTICGNVKGSKEFFFTSRMAMAGLKIPCLILL
jgi:hypothetical protein